MLQINPLAGVLVLELLLAFVFLLGLWGWQSFPRRARERKALQALVVRVNEGAAERRQETRALLEGRFGVKGPALETATDAVCGGERDFYQAVVNLYLKRDAGSAARLDEHVSALTTPYRNIPPGEAGAQTAQGATSVDAAGDDAPAQAGADALREQNQALEKENARLEQELDTAQKTIDKMLSEYATLFGNAGESADASAAAEDADAVSSPEEAPDAPAAVEVALDSPAGEDDVEIVTAGDGEDDRAQAASG